MVGGQDRREQWGENWETRNKIIIKKEKEKVTNGKIYAVPFSKPIIFRAPQMGTFCLGFSCFWLFVCVWEVEEKRWKKQKCKAVSKYLTIHVWKPIGTLWPEVNKFCKEI